MNTIHVDVVSAEESIYSGEARFVALPGESGELGIYPRHTPLITRIKAGSVRIETADGGEEFVFVAGGILEVQPDCVTVLSDTAIRGKDLDEEKANAAKAAAEEALKINLVDFLAENFEDLEVVLQSKLEKLAKNGPIAIRAAKKAIESGFSVDIETGLTIESSCYQTVLNTKDRLEGLKAFSEKRAPVYENK